MCPHSSSQTADQEIKDEVPYVELEDSEMESEEDDANDNETVVWTEADQRNADAMILTMIVKSYFHVSIVEGIAFKRLMAAINDNYVLLERKDITKRILPHMYNLCLEEQKAIVQEAATVCLTTDRWTSVKMENIISITGHFINSEFQLKSVLLKCCEVYDGDSEELATILKETCMEWDVFTKIIWCVTDSSEPIKQAVNSLGWNQSGCTAYKLNLILQKSLKLSKRVLKKVKEIVGYFQSSSEREDMLNNYQTEVQGLEEPMELVDSDTTRWNSTYEMIEVFLTLQDSISASMNEHDDELPDLTNTDWSKLKQLRKLFKPFMEATKELGDNKYVSASKVIPIVNGLKVVLEETYKNPDSYSHVKDEVKCIETELNARFQGLECETNLAISTILDPRYKMTKFLDHNAAKVAKVNLVSEVQNLMKADTNTGPLQMESGESQKTENEGEVLEERLLNTTVNFIQLAQQEVDSYTQVDLADCDPSIWWQANQQKFPHLAQLFKTKCNIVATSIPGGQLFSEKGNDLCENRYKLSANKAAKIVFLNANLEDDEILKFMP